MDTRDDPRADPDVRVQLGKAMIAWREVYGYTQEDLARISGVSIRSISYAEREHRTLSLPSTIRIARAFGVTLDTLLEGPTHEHDTVPVLGQPGDGPV